MRIKNAKFIISVADEKKIPDYNLPEIAICGKSNVGKSSLINLITNNSKLARTSNTPGRTRLINLFNINNDGFILVDLPGYGYAKAPKTDKRKWGELMEGYFNYTKNLKNTFILVDIRHEPSVLDKQMFKFIIALNLPFTCIATKCDKLSKSAVNKQLQVLAGCLGVGVQNIIPTSSKDNTGINVLLSRIGQVLETD